MDASDVELESENSLNSSPRPARKNITLKLKSEKSGSSSGRGRPRKGKIIKQEDQDPSTTDDEVLDTPIFKTMEPGEPIHHNKKLKWDHKVNLLGEKVVDPLIHCCGICSLPILIYGRMIQCKHVFCFTCAKKTEKTCPRCGDPVQRIEQSALGTVFLCTYGGSKHGSNGCRRTYLSQRDLNAHIGHRHLKSEVKDHGPVPTQKNLGSAPTQLKTAIPTGASIQSHQALLNQFTAAMRQVASAASLPQRASQENVYLPGQVGGMSHALPVSSAHQGQVGLTPQSYTPGTIMQSMAALSSNQPIISQSMVSSSASQENYTSAIPVVGSRIKTLISVPIQDDDYSKKHAQPQSYPSHATGGAMPNMNYPPPSFPVGSIAPNMHQPPPSVPPPMFSSQNLPTGPSPSFTSPPPQIMSSGPPPRVPQRMGGPPGGPPPRFFDNQGPRGPWTGGPPRGPSGPPIQPRGPPRADYNYY